MANNKDDIPTPDLPTLQTSLTRLATAAHILDGFVHRNKNQHRGTQWWGPFDMLRRHVRKILPDLEDAVQRAEALSTAAALPGAAKRRKADKGGRAAAAKQPELDRVVQRAQWVHGVVGANAYGAFTQVAADRQFAQLGLALIGVLAQVEAALVPFVKVKSDADPADELDATEAAAYMSGTKGDHPLASETQTLDPNPSGGGDDMGVAISRDDLDDDDLPSKKERSLPPPEPSLSRKQDRSSMTKSEKVKATDEKSKKRKNAEPQLGTLKDEKKLKKKKRKKGGDEFDDLFSTLV